MKYYLHYDSNGTVISVHSVEEVIDTEIDTSEVPEPFIEITEDEYIKPFGLYVLYYVNDGELKFVPPSIDNLKFTKKLDLSLDYNNEFITGYFHSGVLGIDVDFRRNSTKNDLQNIDICIENMTDSGITETIFKGYQNQTAIATLDQMRAMRKELIAYGTSLFDKKSLLISQIDACTTKEQLDLIKWK